MLVEGNTGHVPRLPTPRYTQPQQGYHVPVTANRTVITSFYITSLIENVSRAVVAYPR